MFYLILGAILIVIALSVIALMFLDAITTPDYHLIVIDIRTVLFVFVVMSALVSGILLVWYNFPVC